MGNPLRKRLRPAETNQLDALAKRIEWLEEDVHFFGLLFYDTPQLGGLLRDFVQETFQGNNVAYQTSDEFKIKPIVAGKNAHIVYSEESPSASFLNNLNVSRDGLMSRAAKLIFILPEASFPDWNVYAFDFLSRASGGAGHFYDLAKYDVVGEPDMSERTSELVELREDFERIKLTVASEVTIIKVLNIAHAALRFSDYYFTFEVAMFAYNRAEILRNSYLLAESLRYRVSAMIGTGQLREAMPLLTSEERLREELNDGAGLAGLHRRKALIFERWGRLDQAIEAHRKAEGIYLELGDQRGVATSNADQAHILLTKGQMDYNHARQLYKNQEKIFEQTGDQRGLGGSYASQANLLLYRMQLNEAMTFCKKEEKIMEEIGDANALAGSYGRQGDILRAWGRMEEAMRLHNKEEEIYVRLGNKEGLAISYRSQTQILTIQGEYQKALSLSRKHEMICENSNHIRGLANAYNDQAIILNEMEQPHKALSLAEKQEKLCESLGDLRGLANCYGNQANIISKLGQSDLAFVLYKMKAEIDVKLGDKKEVAKSYGNQAKELLLLGEIDEALSLHRKEEQIFNELGDKLGLLHCYFSLGVLLFYRFDRQSEGLAYLGKSLNLSRDLNMNQAGFIEETLIACEQVLALPA